MHYVSIPAGAKILNVCPATLRSRVKNGDLPVYTFGKRAIRLDIDEVRRLARSVAEGKGNEDQTSGSV